MNTGYLNFGRVRGALVRVHWSAFALALLIGLLQGPVGVGLLSAVFVFTLIMAHEFGHAFMVWRYRQTVHAIEVFAFHGWCRWSGHVTAYERAMIAWGGIFAQLALLSITIPIALIFAPFERGVFLTALVHVFTWTNLYFIGINLIPISPLDGHEAWKLVNILKARRPERPRLDDVPPPRRPAAPRAKRRANGHRPKLRLLTPPPGEKDPVSRSSQRIADEAIRDALDRSKRKFEGRNPNDD
jgi:hypothetical protein